MRSNNWKTVEGAPKYEVCLARGVSCADLGRKYKVTPEAISLIKHGKNWGWLK